MPFLYVDKRSDIPCAVFAMHHESAGHHVPLLQALYRGHITFLEMRCPGSSRLFKQWAAAAGMLAAARISNDGQASLYGPDTWPIARRMFRWARFVLIHGNGGRLKHYECAVQPTGTSVRLAVAECSSANVEAQRDAAARWAANTQGGVMQPPPGFPNPSLDKGHVQ